MTITKDDLISQRGDLSDFLFHLTRSGQFRWDKDLYSRDRDDFGPITAKQSLISIIQQRRIEARSPFGYFNYKVRLNRGNKVLNQHSQVQREWLRAVCFSETPLDHVKLQTKTILGRALHFQPYGLAFREAVVRRARGNPIFYVHTANQALRDTFDVMAVSPACAHYKPMMPLVEGFGRPWFPRFDGPSEVDFRWEREWRIAGDFSFSLDDIAFGLCPQSEHQEFSRLTSGKIPFVDPQGDIKTVKAELRKWEGLGDLK